MCVYEFEGRLIDRPIENGWRQICHFFTIMLAIKTPSNDVFFDVVAHDIDLFIYEGHRYEYRSFGKIKRDYLQTVAGRASITMISNIMSHVGFRLAYLELF